MEAKKVQIYFFFLMFLLVVALSFFVFKPYISAIILAGALAILVRPLYKKIIKKIPHEGSAAFLSTMCIFLVFFVPLVLLGAKVVSEAIQLYGNTTQENTTQILTQTTEKITNFLPASIDVARISSEINTYIEGALSWVISNIGNFFSSALELLMNLLIIFLAIYYFLKEGAQLKKFFINTIPLPKKDLQEIFEEVKRAVSSVLKGTLMVGIIQGITLGIGFFLFGVPQPAFWGAVGILASFTPVIGLGIIIFPVSIFMILSGDVVGGIGAFLWGALIAGTIDNVLRPILIKKEGMKIHSFIIFLSIMGGLAFFGPLGFLFGPLTLSILIAFLNIYPSFVKK